MTNIPIKMRRATVDDLPFFYSATLQSHFYSSPTTKFLLPGIYYAEHKKVLERLISSTANILTLACTEDDLAVILGYALHSFDGKYLHYMYVKRAFRKFGIARELLAEAMVDLSNCQVSHWTNDMGEIWRNRLYPNLIYNPYLLVN